MKTDITPKGNNIFVIKDMPTEKEEASTLDNAISLFNQNCTVAIYEELQQERKKRLEFFKEKGVTPLIEGEQILIDKGELILSELKTLYNKVGPKQEEKDELEFEKITGFKTKEEYTAYELGRTHEEKVYFKFIEDWKEGETNSVIGQLLQDKLIKQSVEQVKGDSKSMLSELLAVLHADGGHYEEAHGTKKAVEDAMTKYYALRSLVEDDKQ